MNPQRQTPQLSLDDLVKDTETYSGRSAGFQTFPPESVARRLNSSQNHSILPIRFAATVPLPMINDQSFSLSTYRQPFPRVDRNCRHIPAFQEDDVAFVKSYLPPLLNVSDIVDVTSVANLQTQVSQMQQTKRLDLISRDLLLHRYKELQVHPYSHQRTTMRHVMPIPAFADQSHLAQSSLLDCEIMLHLQRIVSSNSASISTRFTNLVHRDTISTMKSHDLDKRPIETNESTSHASVNSSVKCPIPKKRTRPKDMPFHPLTAYNFFFREEREQILSTLSRGESIDEMKDNDSNYKLNSEELQMNFMLHVKKQRDQKKKKRPHRKTHGKISFKSLAQLISSRWKLLSSVKQEYYHKLAEMGMEHYRNEMKKYKKRKTDIK